MPRKKELVNTLKKGEVVIMPSDTVYGLFGLARKQQTLDKMTRLKDSSLDKSFVILVADWSQFKELGIKISEREKKLLRNIWPGKVNVVLSGKNPRFSYLSHNNELTIRWPKHKFLSSLIKKTGPLVFSNASKANGAPAETITEARAVFGDQIDFYLSAGRRLKNDPPTLLLLENDKVKVIKKGALSRKELKQKLHNDLI